MAYKAFAAPTGSGNTVFEGDVLNGSVSPDGKSVVLKFYTNDRGYACASFGRVGVAGQPLDLAGVKSLKDELSALLDAHAAKIEKFQASSSQKHYTLGREGLAGPLILGVIGTDARFGAAYHRGAIDDLKKLLAEFDLVLKTIEDIGKAAKPAAA